jgi:hypothetical protein
MIGIANAPTFSYPRLRYSPQTGVTITRDFREAVVAFLPTEIAERTVNRTASGKAEYLFSRIEETVRVDLRCEAAEMMWLRRFFRDHGAKGAPFEFWIDRHTGSCWMFEDSLEDQNGLAMTLSTGSASYADAAERRGISLSGSQFLSVALAQSSATTRTGYDDPLDRTQGVVVIDFVPSWSGNDGVLHYVLDTSGPNNRLSILKTSGNLLTFRVTDNAGGQRERSGAVSWPATTRVILVASWATDGTLRFLRSEDGGATWTDMTTASGTGTGVLSALPATLYLGAQNDGTALSNGVYDTVAFFKRAFADPHRTLARYLPVWRNYFPYAELVPQQFEMVRLVPGRLIWQWPLILRNGVA